MDAAGDEGNLQEIKKKHTKKVPPDGGWGWMVLLGTLLVNILIPGLLRSFGILLIEFVEEFHVTEFIASGIPALCYFLYCSLGPITSYLSTKYSYRMVTLLGGSFASIGMMFSYFANSIYFLYISFGIFVGIGAGLSFPAGIFIVTSYFRKFRGLANGVAISGSSIGSIILPPLLRYLIEDYGVRGTMLILGALTLNVLVGGLLYHPVEEHMKTVEVESEDEITKENENLLLTPIEITRSKPCDEIIVVEGDSRRRSSSHRSKGESRIASLTRTTFSSTSSLKYCSSVFHGSTLVGLQPPKKQKVKRKKRKPQKPQSELNKLLANPAFLLVLFANGANSIGYTNFIILLPSYALSLHFTKANSSYLLSVLAVFDLIGRVGISTLSDHFACKKRYFFICGMLVAGTVLVILPVTKSYNAMCVLCAIFGISSGTYVGITVVTMIELVGEEKLASSYTITLFVNGILQLVGPPMCGLFYEYVQSYAILFHTLGSILFLGGAIWFVPITEIKDHETSKASR